jgi:hypothetical protein
MLRRKRDENRLRLLARAVESAGSGVTILEEVSAVVAKAPPDTAPESRDIEPPSDALGSVRRRARLALRYCAPADLIRQAMAGLEAQPDEAAALPIQANGDLPEVLVDREQVAGALKHLLANAVQRAGSLKRVRVRLAQAEALGERGVRTEPFVRVDILFEREEITEEDLGSEAEAARRRPYRREDLASAGQLLQANGGRLVPSPEGEERCLSALIPAASRPPTPPI